MRCPGARLPHVDDEWHRLTLWPCVQQYPVGSQSRARCGDRVAVPLGVALPAVWPSFETNILFVASAVLSWSDKTLFVAVSVTVVSRSWVTVWASYVATMAKLSNACATSYVSCLCGCGCDGVASSSGYAVCVIEFTLLYDGASVTSAVLLVTALRLLYVLVPVVSRWLSLRSW